ncbi:MAG: hypothetical protein HUU28_05175 [Planctomycetaceae bacterium]|nr:hypothetical protein [Planctomycetaceae bacterium]
MHAKLTSLFRSTSAVALFALASATASAQTVINANPGPANNGGSPNWAMFFDVAATGGDFLVTELTTASNAGANVQYSVEVLVYTGSGLGGPVASGPGSSPVGWTSLGTVSATQGATASGISLPIDIPDITVLNGQTTGVALRFTGAGPRYFGTGTPAYSVYSDANLALTTGDARSAPFTTTGSFFTSRALVGSITYESLASGPVTYCTGGTTTSGCVASISADAQPSVSAANACNIAVASVEGQKSGLIFYSINGQQAQAWNATSFLCVKAPTQRTPTQTSGGTVGACDGSLSLDWNAFQAANPTALGNPWSSGDTVQVQAWFRDPPAGKATNLSDAVELTYAP